MFPTKPIIADSNLDAGEMSNALTHRYKLYCIEQKDEYHVDTKGKSNGTS